MKDRRRAWLRAAAGVATATLVSAARPLWAQDPRTSGAVAAAHDWLVLVDKGDLEGSHASAGKRFRDALSAPAWRASLGKARDPRGPMQQRTLFSSRFEGKSVPESKAAAPGTSAAEGNAGDIAILVYRTSFAKQADTRETVTLEREAGSWRVIGYFIH